MAGENDNIPGLLARLSTTIAQGTLTGSASGSLSGSIATSGGTASITFTSTTKTEIVNPSTGVLWARWGGTPAVNGVGSFPIAPNGYYSPGAGTSGTLQLLSTAANQPYTVNRFS